MYESLLRYINNRGYDAPVIKRLLVQILTVTFNSGRKGEAISAPPAPLSSSEVTSDK